MKHATNLFQRGLTRRILSLALAAFMVISMSPPMTAASALDSGEVTLLSGFAPLPDEVRLQNVALGVSLADLTLPDTLETYLAEPNFADEEQAPPVEREPEEELPPDEREPEEELSPAASEPEDTKSSETNSGTPPQSSSSETGSTPSESSSAPENAPPESSSAPESAPDAPPSESREPAADESADEQAQASPDEPAAGETTGADEPATQVLAAYVQSDIAQSEGEATTPATVTVKGITWTSDPLYDSETEGTYLFTAVLPSGYTVEDGVAMPEITIVVGQAEQSAVDKVIAMIDALPTMDEWTAMDETAARAVMDKILAAKAAYDALTVEEKAQIDEARMAKLLELAELAEQMALMMPMAATAFGTNCTWEVTAEGVLILAPKTSGGTGTLPTFSGSSTQPWNSQEAQIKAVKVESGVKASKDSKYLFANLSACTSMDLSGLDTTAVTNMKAMINNCRELASVTFGSSFNTSIVTDMSGMFGGCKGLTSLDVSSFNTMAVTDMSNMFSGCNGLNSLDVSNFNTEKVTTMSAMFSGYKGLTSLDLRNFNTANVTKMSLMFSGCSGLNSLDLSSFNTANVTDMSSMFSGCSGLTSLDLSNFNTPNVTNMSRMFNGCSGLTSLDLSNFNTPNVTDMSSMFYGCSGLTSLNLSQFTTAAVTNMSSMFLNCGGLTSLDVSNFNTAEVTNMSSMFNGCSSLTSLDLSNFTFTKVTNMSSMFNGCNVGLKTNVYKTAMSGTGKIYLYDKHSVADFISGNTDLVGTGGNIVYKPYTITNSATNGTISTSSRFNATDYQNYFTKTAPLYSSGAPTYDGTKDYAQQGETVTITLTPDSGYGVDTVTVTQGSTPVTLSGTGNTRTFTMPAGDVTITATFKSLGYPVTITAQKDGSAWSGHGKTFKLSKDGGSTFVPDLTKVPDGTYTIYEGSTSTGVTVTVSGAATSATVDYYTVTFYDGGTAYGTPAPQVVLKTVGRVTKPTDPSKTGYTFAGWKTTNGGATAFDFTNTAITATRGVFASWTAKTDTGYTVKHYQEQLAGGYPATPTDTDSLSGTTNTSVTPPVKSYSGFTAPATQTVTIAADGSTVVEYRYTRNSYTLAWNANGGNLTGGTAAGSVKFGASLTAPTATKQGYDFASWNPAVPATMPAADTTLDAVWTLNAPTVSLAVDKATATYNGGATVATLTATPGHAAGGVSYAYEWYRGSTKLTGTGSTMPLTDVAASGSYTVKVTASDGTLTSAQATSNAVTVTINKADVQIDTAPTASGITYGQTLASSTLSGGAATQKPVTLFGRMAGLFRSGTAVPGSFAWTTPTTNPAVSNSGTTPYSVTFTPTDTANYNTATTTIKLTVGKKPLTPSVATVANREYNGGTDATGTLALSGAVLGQSPTASGTFAFTSAAAGENKTVGVSGIALEGTWGDNYTLSADSLADVNTAAKITPKGIGLAWSGDTGLVYTGSSVNVTVTATGLVGTDICAVTVNDGTQINAGNHTATAAAVSNPNYKLPTAATHSYTIAKAPVSFAVSDNEHSYDGTAKTATVAQTAGETPDVSGKFTVSYAKDGTLVASPTNKGQYDIIVTITNANFKHSGQADSVTAFKVGTLTIDGTPYPDADTMTWPTADVLTYGQTLADSALTGGDQAAKGSYAWKDGTTVPTVTNSGYTVVFAPTDTNYASVEHTVSITVAKATPTLALPTAAGITYGDTLAKSALSGGSASAAYNGVANINVPGGYAWTAPATKPAVSDSGSTEYALTFTPDDTDNYNVVSSGKAKLAVAQKAVGLAWTGDTALVYSGAPVGVTATATQLEAGDSCTVTISGGTGTNVGTHTATATAVSNPNYKLPADVTQAYTIAKAPVSFAVTANEHDYDAAAKTATVAQTAGEAPAVSGKFTVSYAKDGSPVATPTNADVYDVLVTLTDANYKHKGSEDDVREIKVGTLTINGVKYPQADTMTWPTAAGITYGQTLADSALTGGDQATKGTYTWTTPDTVPTVQNDGYWVVFTPTDTNYAPVEHTVSITVAKATPTLALPTAAGITYGDTLAKSALSGGSASAAYNGVANINVPGGYAWTAPATKPAVSDSGSTEYALTFTPDDTDNYNVVSSGKAKLAVAQKAVGLAWAGHTALVYSGAPVGVTATATQLEAGDSCTVTVTDGGKTDAGSYTAKATAVSNPNYKLPADVEQAYTIAQKPIKVLWSDMFPTYDGTAKSPTVALEGVVNGEDCTAVSTASAAAGNAGRYKVAAALQGARSGNYTMQNPGEILVIQPAPVRVSLRDYSYKYDGAAKYAIVNITPDVPFSVTYKLIGNEVAAPTEEGVYDVLVGLGSKNYRFDEGTDGKTRRVGALTIYKEKPPELYTIAFVSGAAEASGTPPAFTPAVKDTVHFLPSNPFLRVGHAFVGWKNGDKLYQPDERFIQPANNDTVFTAQWETATYDIGGVVDQDGKPVANVRIVLMRGAEQVAETVTNQIGEYRFNSVLPGLYNLVACKPSPDGMGDIIMTIMAEVKAADVEQANITLPSGKTNSIVEVVPGTPKIIVGNLDQTFRNTVGNDFTPEDQEVVSKGGAVEIKFIAQEKQESEIAGDAEEISKEAGNAKIGLYLSLNVEKTVTQPADPSIPDVEPSSNTTPIPQTSVLLESVIPLPKDLQGKQSYTVYRMHEGAVDSLTTDAGSGERIEVDEEKTKLTLYAQKFSTYAIAYTEKSSGGSGGGDDSGGNGGSGLIPRPDPIRPKQPAPVAPAAPAAPAASAPQSTAPGAVPNPGQPESTQPNSPDADGADKAKPDQNNEQKLDSGDKEALKDEIRAALEDAIKNLPDTLTDEQRQEYINRLTEISDTAIAALDGTNDPDEALHIVAQTREDIKHLLDEALAAVGQTDAGKPFIVASALLALAAVLLAVFALLKRQDKKRKLFSAIFAALAVIAFLLTSGWSGFALANGWTLVVAAFGAGAAIGVFVRHSKDEEQPQTK